MGVDYYYCESCLNSKYEEYIASCTGCGNSLCTSCLVNKDFESRFAQHYGIRFDSNNEELKKQLIEENGSIINEDGSYYWEDGDILDDSAIQPKYCPFCNGDKIDRDKVLDHLLTKYKLDIKKIWKEINL